MWYAWSSPVWAGSWPGVSAHQPAAPGLPHGRWGRGPVGWDEASGQDHARRGEDQVSHIPGSLQDDPDVLEIDALIQELSQADLLGAGEGLTQIAERALAVSAATRRLLDRGRAALVRLEGGMHG